MNSYHFLKATVLPVPCIALTHPGGVMHIYSICTSKETIISLDNGLAHVKRQAIIGTNDGLIVKWKPGNKFLWNWD